MDALKKLGGSGTVSEIEKTIIDDLKIPQDQVEFIHNEKDGSRKLDYNLRWARNYLKRVGFIQNSSRGVWALTPLGEKQSKIDQKEVVKQVRVALKENEKAALTETKEEDQTYISEIAWRVELLQQIKKISPSGFERLSQRFLRELGFNNVTVTGKTGDGGIDGFGQLTIGSVVTFKIAFQCKRYDGSVPVDKIRDFRGSIIGRAEKGLLITTGTFSSQGRQEAQRDGALPIDLIDGDQFVEKIKDLRLGVDVVPSEEVTIQKEFFKQYS
jgi:restriction system protein